VKIFSQNSLIPIQILNGFFIFYCATWDPKDSIISNLIFQLDVPGLQCGPDEFDDQEASTSQSKPADQEESESQKDPGNLDD
jgi:hypothetical protein